MDDILKALKDGLDQLLEGDQDSKDNTELKLPDPVKMSLNHAIALTDKYESLDKRLDILKFWFDSEKTRIEKQKEFIEKCCEGFMLNYMERCGSKSLILPNGHKFGLRKCPDSVEIKDEEKAIDWCKENLKEACKEKISLLKKPIIDYVKSTGSLPAGIEFISSESKGLSFSIS